MRKYDVIKEIPSNVIEKLAYINALKYTVPRNQIIFEKFLELRKHESILVCYTLLSNQFNLSEENIRKIVTDLANEVV